MRRILTPRIGTLLVLLMILAGSNGCGSSGASTADATALESDAPSGSSSASDITPAPDADVDTAATPDTAAEPGDDAPEPEPDAPAPADVAPEESQAPWPVGACDDQPVGNGVKVGDIAMDFEMMDQYGQMVRLHDFCDKTILLVGSAFWCPGCIDKAPTLDAIYQAHKDKGLLIITLLTETLDNLPCSQADLKLWADEYGQTFPVLSDVDGYIHTFTPKEGGKLPMEVLLGPGVEILTVIDDITEQDLIDVLP